LEHLDAYRLRGEAELADLDFASLTGPDRVVAIEWAEKVARLLPPETIWITFTPVSPRERRLTFSCLAPEAVSLPWLDRLKGLKFLSGEPG